MNVSVASLPQSLTAAILPLTQLEIGSAATVAKINVPTEQRGRILEMGLLVGTKVQLVRFAPMGDPVEIKLRGYHLTLRRTEADQIHVTAAA
jgi:ferrous iron transport protein A